jgi:hypothetical protein
MDVGAFINNIGESLAKASEKLNPLVGEAVKTLDQFGQEKLAPALTVAGNSLHKFGEQQLVPALAGARTALGEFGQDKLAPAAAVAGAVLSELGERNLGPALASTHVAIDQFGREILVPALKDTEAFILKNPIQVALISIALILPSFPSLFSSPILWILGWCKAGIRAGTYICLQCAHTHTHTLSLSLSRLFFPRFFSLMHIGGEEATDILTGSIAAGLQSFIGNVAPGSLFAILQSAAMNGYGAVVLESVLRLRYILPWLLGGAKMIFNMLVSR